VGVAAAANLGPSPRGTCHATCRALVAVGLRGGRVGASAREAAASHVRRRHAL